MRNRLYGEYNHTIDKKKRMFLPAKIRESLGENIIMVKSLSAKCIAIYPEDEWEKFEDKIEVSPQLNNISVKRKIYSSLEEATPDTQGRILIPQKLYDYACLEKDVIIIGAGDHAELWNEENRLKAIEEEEDPELVESLKNTF